MAARLQRCTVTRLTPRQQDGADPLCTKQVPGIAQHEGVVICLLAACMPVLKPVPAVPQARSGPVHNAVCFQRLGPRPLLPWQRQFSLLLSVFMMLRWF